MTDTTIVSLAFFSLLLLIALAVVIVIEWIHGWGEW